MARHVTIGGIPVRDTSSDAVLRFLDRCVARRRPLAVGFVNHNFVLTCRELEDRVGDLDGLLLVNDGIGVELAARLAHRRGFRENLNGTDLVPRYLREARPQLAIFLLGGPPAVVSRAAAMVDSMPRRRVVGHLDGYSIWSDQAAAVRAINLARPDVLLVGLGNPRQERFVVEHRSALDVPVILGVGALFEWMAGTMTRAPFWMRRLRIEWLWRLTLEPRRLGRRYTIDVVRFFAIVLRNRG